MRSLFGQCPKLASRTGNFLNIWLWRFRDYAGSGNGSLNSAVGNWQRSFRRLFRIVNLRPDDGSPKRFHPHMFRDTFAVEMLLAGVPLEQVSIRLGYKSVKITEKHYAPWVKARQELLAANVRKAWTV